MHCLLHCLADKQLTGFAAGFTKWQPDGAAADATLIVFKRTFLQEKLEVFILEFCSLHIYLFRYQLCALEASVCECVCACLSPDTTWPYFTAFKQRVNTHAYCKSPLNARKNFTIPNMRFS